MRLCWSIHKPLNFFPHPQGLVVAVLYCFLNGEVSSWVPTFLEQLPSSWIPVQELYGEGGGKENVLACVFGGRKGG